ncbi:MAG TPA: ferrochelatase [Longimicrobiales bacterium]|nr:ferrochelatase [Longimicrobiales bacterium]
MTTIGVLTLNFGEPDEATPEKVVPFLERIFLQNGGLERIPAEARAARARELAEARAPGLIEEYREIGGSPLNRQADRHAEALEQELTRRGHDVRVYSCFQYTAPFVADAVAQARGDGVERLVALPVYPICGHSTTVAAIDGVEAALEALGWDVPLAAVGGWHKHVDYLKLRVDGIRAFVEEQGLDLDADDTILYFSAHGTPIKYLDEGNRYDRYVDEHCADIATALGARRYAVGFQNHTNRRIPWTQPDNEDRIEALSERHLVVDPVSFVHEQSETLAELDHELRAFIEEKGKVLHRVPVPFDSEALPRLMATLVEEALDVAGGGGARLAPCRCRPKPRTWCTNGDRDLPASPFGPSVSTGAAS